MTRPFHRLTRHDGERGRVGVRIRRAGATMRSHRCAPAAVGSTDESSQALAAGSQHELPTHEARRRIRPRKRQQRAHRATMTATARDATRTTLAKTICHATFQRKTFATATPALLPSKIESTRWASINDQKGTNNGLTILEYLNEQWENSFEQDDEGK